MFPFAAVYRPALGPNILLIRLAQGVLSSGVKWAEREADQSPVSYVEVRNACCYTSTPPILRGVLLSTGTTLPYLTLRLPLESV
jgi:hypothetical protein